MNILTFDREKYIDSKLGSIVRFFFFFDIIKQILLLVVHIIWIMHN